MAIVPVFPFICYLVNEDIDVTVAEIQIILNLVTLRATSSMENNYGIAAALKMSENLSVALSHMLLAGTGIYCLIQIKDDSVFLPHATFGIITVHNIIAVWRWGSDQGLRVNDIYNFTSYTQLLFALPCITTTLWLANGYQREISWAWAIVPMIPFVCYLINDFDMTLIEIMVLLNSAAVGAVSFKAGNNFGIAAAVAYAISHFCINRFVVYNCGLCFFAYFSLRALGYGG
ncbi:hypothetical protein BDFB_013399 [Asbolus verrucosus]|uniref:Uncharacterized protein n=1 Tax=Asbolus verrucosus TaxID=1661398 RepID=A0A482VT45_ASBVE|nr:hypothetical protein BDFB_013399 [Asbolus verrucosus]